VFIDCGVNPERLQARRLRYMIERASKPTYEAYLRMPR
jgi:hypothetical protein